MIATLLVGCSSGSSSEAGGAPLPEAELVDLETGNSTAWPDDGRPVVINFWASWCTPCRKEMPAFEQVANELGDQVTIIGVTDEADLDAARGAAEQAGVTYPLLVDEGLSVQADLGVTGLPATVFVDADGTVVGKHLGAMTEDELTTEIEDRYAIT